MANSVATLVSNPEAPAVSDALLSRIAQVLPRGAKVIRLDKQIAVDILFDAENDTVRQEVRRRIQAMIREDAVDLIVQPTANRRKKLFIADMDSTMIGQECIDELADVLGLRDHVAAITERAMRGELDFEPALRERVALLKGLDHSMIGKVIQDRITITPGARTLVATLRAHGAYTALVSGGFTAFTGPISQSIGFEEHRGNALTILDGILSGEVKEPILGRAAKREALIDLRDMFSLDDIDTLAIGDGANDIDMIRAAGLGIAFRAKPVVAEAAHARLDHADLTGLLYAQGYPRASWME